MSVDCTDLTDRANNYLTQIRVVLDGVEDIDTAVEVTNRVKALHKYARSAKKSLEMQNEIAELKLRSERAAGKLLAELKLQGGDRKSKNRNSKLSLAELGITKHESSQWQREAKISDEVFDAYCESQRSSDGEITQVGLVRSTDCNGSTRRKQPHLCCPRCGLRDNLCKRSGKVQQNVKPRDRECMHCGYQMRTWEVVIDPHNPPHITPYFLPLRDDQAEEEASDNQY